MYRGPGFSKMFLLSSLLTPIKQTPNLNLKEEYKSLRITFGEKLSLCCFKCLRS